MLLGFVDTDFYVRYYCFADNMQIDSTNCSLVITMPYSVRKNISFHCISISGFEEQSISVFLIQL